MHPASKATNAIGTADLATALRFHLGRFARFTISLWFIWLTGCATAPRHPVPKESADSAQLPGWTEVRFMMDPGSTNTLNRLDSVLKGVNTGGGSDHHLKILALSGGGENGAYGAGLLCGWTE